MNVPPFNNPEIPYWERSFYWVHNEPGVGKTTGYWTGPYNDRLNGFITYTFSMPIIGFAMQMQLIDMTGHFMKAYDQLSGGNLVDSVSFGLGSGTWRVDVETLQGTGIRRVEVHAPLAGPNQYGDYSPLDQVVRQAAFRGTPCPPTGDPWFDSTAVRDTIIGVYNAAVAGPELMVMIYKNPLRIYTPNQTRTTCEADYSDYMTPLGLADPDLVGFIHGHSLGVGDMNTCNSPPTPYDVFPSNGLSGLDVQSAFVQGAYRILRGLPVTADYVIDKDKIWLNPPATLTGTNFGKNVSVPRVPTSCTWR